MVNYNIYEYCDSVKQLLLFCVFAAGAWLILVASCTLFECHMEAINGKPISTVDFRSVLLNALNVAFPTCVIGLLLLLRINKMDPLGSEVFLLLLVTVVLACFVAYKAKNAAFLDPSDPQIVETIWWLPEPSGDGIGVGSQWSD